MKKIILLFIATLMFAFNKCDTKLFSISTQGNSSIKLQTLLSNLSDTCNLNIVVKDSLTQKKLDNYKLRYLKLNNLPLNDFLSHILGESGFFWKLKDSTLEINYIALLSL